MDKSKRTNTMVMPAIFSATFALAVLWRGMTMSGFWMDPMWAVTICTMVLAVWAIGLVVLGTAIFRDRSMASALEGRWPQFGLRAMFAMTALIGLMIFARQNQTLNEQWRKQAESLQSKNATLEAQNKNLELRLKSANDLLRAQSKRLQAQSKRPNPPSSPTIASPPPSDQESP